MPTVGQAQTATFDLLRNVAFGSITSGYVALGTPLGHLTRLIILTNNTDKDVLVSIDGVNDYLYLVAGTFKLLDVSTNRETACNFYLPLNTQFYVKYASAPSKGNFFIECMYGVGE